MDPNAIAQPVASESTYLSFRRNFVLLVGNYVLFGIGLAFFNANTVMPVFLSHLTDSQPLIGLASAIFPLGWMIPQLLSARWIIHHRRRKPFLVYPSLAAPAIFTFFALVMSGMRAEGTGILLPLFIIGMAVLAVIDGIIGVPWLDFVGSAIPGRLRGRMMGIQEMVSALASIGVGVLVGFLLAENAPVFPTNFAWLAACAAGAYFLAWLLLLPLQEPGKKAASRGKGSPIHFLPLLREILRHDSGFRTLIGLRLLNGFTNMSLPFYVLYATARLGIPPSAIGLFLSLQLVSSAAGTMSLGLLYERYGSRLVIRLVTAAGLLAPLLALVVPGLGLSDAALPFVFGLVFLATGISGTSSAAIFVGYTNFMIDYTEPERRPAYLGLGNTLVGPIALTGMLGGWLLQHTSYVTLFACTAVFLFLAQFQAWRLPDPPRR